MKEILIACGDIDLLRTLVGDLPADQFKPIATRRGAGIVAKLAGRHLSLAIVHAELEDGAAQQLLAELRNFDAQLPILYLTPQKPPAAPSPQSGKQPGEQTPFDTALQYPLPGPVFRNAVRRLTENQHKTHDLEKWRTFYNEVKLRLEAQPTQNYYAILSVADDAPHHMLVTSFDALSLRYHPDRYHQFQTERWGKALHEKLIALYKTMTEAYAVLSDRRQRARYQQALENGELRIAFEDTKAEKGPRSIEELATSASAKRFLRLAQTDIAKNDLTSAAQNLTFALSMEPHNAAIADYLAKLQKKITP